MNATNTSDARNQSPSEPLAAQDRTSKQDVVRDPSASERPSEGENPSVSQPSMQDVTTAMSSAEDTRQQNPLLKDTNEQFDHETVNRARVTETILSGATLLEGAESRKDSADVILDKSDQSQSVQSSERGESLLSSTARGKLNRGLATLIDKHTEVLAARVNTEESRTRLKVSRHALEKLDAQYMEKLENFSANDSVRQVARLKHDFGELQVARAEILALEGEYEEEATRLVQLEAELRNMESKIYNTLVKSTANSSGQPNEEFSEGDRLQQDLLESDVAERDMRLDHPPEVRVYLSQLGDVNMLRERLMDKDTQHVQVTGEKTLREELGLEPEEDTEAFLASFEIEREALVTQLNDAENILATLAANLEEQENLPRRVNPFADDGRRPEGPSREHSLFGKDDYQDDEAVERHNLANKQVLAAAEALLLSQEDSQLVYADVTIDADGMSINKASYINCWQLHRLRNSTREVARLIEEQQAFGVRISPEHLKAKVLETWMHDETIHSFDFPHLEVHARDLSMATHSGASRHSRPASDSPIRAWQTGERLMQRRLSISHAETTR